MISLQTSNAWRRAFWALSLTCTRSRRDSSSASHRSPSQVLRRGEKNPQHQTHHSTILTLCLCVSYLRHVARIAVSQNIPHIISADYMPIGSEKDRKTVSIMMWVFMLTAPEKASLFRCSTDGRYAAVLLLFSLLLNAASNQFVLYVHRSHVGIHVLQHGLPHGNAPRWPLGARRLHLRRHQPQTARRWN